MRVFVICNPKAGNGLAIKAGEMVKGALASRGIYYEFACGIKRPEIFSGTFMSGKAFIARCGVNA